MSLIFRGPPRPLRSMTALRATTTSKGFYQGPDRRAASGDGDLYADDCREQARLCFAQAVASEDAAERERFRQKGEHWMTRWRNWAPRGFRPNG